MFNSSMRPFSILLIGQAISLFGSVLTGFALAIWAFKQSDSQAMVYAAIAVANSLPVFLLGPIAGAAADRWNRKKIILASQISAISITGALTVLYYLDILEVWHIISLIALNSVFTAFVLPTVTATVPLMVPKGFLTRANGLIALAFGIIELLSPAISGALYESYGLKTIFIIDLCTFAIGLSAVIITKIPQPPKSERVHEDFEKESFFTSIKTGFNYIRENDSLLYLIIFFAVVAACIRAIGLMVQPMVLGFADAKTLGFIMSTAGSGVLVGSLLLIPFKDVNKHMPIIIGVAITIAICCILTPITTNAYLLALGGFLLMSCFPILDTNNRVLFQRKIESVMLGRIIGFRNFALGIFQTAAVIGCGLLADNVFEPGMKEAGWLAAIFSDVYGTGKGRGIALLISIIGAALLIIVLTASFNRKLRSIDSSLDDIEVDLEQSDTVDSATCKQAP
jgi:MFS family permease